MISIVANGLVPILFKACLRLGKIIKFVYLFLLCPQDVCNYSSVSMPTIKYLCCENKIYCCKVHR